MPIVFCCVLQKISTHVKQVVQSGPAFCRSPQERREEKFIRQFTQTAFTNLFTLSRIKMKNKTSQNISRARHSSLPFKRCETSLVFRFLLLICSCVYVDPPCTCRSTIKKNQTTRQRTQNFTIIEQPLKVYFP